MSAEPGFETRAPWLELSTLTLYYAVPPMAPSNVITTLVGSMPDKIQVIFAVARTSSATCKLVEHYCQLDLSNLCIRVFIVIHSIMSQSYGLMWIRLESQVLFVALAHGSEAVGQARQTLGWKTYENGSVTRTGILFETLSLI